MAIKCPNCGSMAIGKFRMDSDWGSGGDWVQENDNDALYSKEDLADFENNRRPDIQCYVCCRCHTAFE
jgi:DNA-directed RNA polymerase subunit RPC12/RpoP